MLTQETFHIHRNSLQALGSIWLKWSLEILISTWSPYISKFQSEKTLFPFKTTTDTSVQTVVLRSFSRGFCPLKRGWCTHQEPPAVPEAPAPVLPRQHEREGLTRRKGMAHCRDYSRTAACLQGGSLSKGHSSRERCYPLEGLHH